MGKKGKRSRRKTVTAVDGASIVAKIKEKEDKVHECFNSNLYSQAADELREGIQLIEVTMLRANNIQSFLFKNKMIFYSDLMWAESSLHNFSAVIQIYEKLFQKDNLKMKRKMKLLSHIFPSLELKYHEALLRQGKGSIDTFISFSKSLISHGRKDIDYLDIDLENDLRRCADILRTTKHFDAAIVIGKELAELTGDKVSLATTYLEQYLVEYYPKFGRTVVSLPENFVPNMGNAFGSMIKKHQNGGFNKNNAGPLLVLAQWTYLLHQYPSSSGDTEVIRNAIVFLEKSLNLFSNLKTHCIACKQSATESEVQFICSGCRVACYCSIDHQRMDWKKDANTGMRFGHEVLCPVMKAHRKWRHALSNDKDGKDDKVSKLRRRFERECLHCLSDGLGLRKKCFQK